MANGTLSVSDLLATQATVLQIGEDKVWESVDIALKAHNAILADSLSALAEITSDRDRRYGGPDSMTMVKVGEYGTPDAQKIGAGSRVDFPLYKHGVSVQWTKDYFENATGKEFAEQFIAAMDADARAAEADIRSAFFGATNSTVIDRLRDNQTLSVKALVNADGAPIPPSYDGTTFNGSTHTHYLYTAGTTLASADLDAAIATVREHYNTGKMVVYINQAQLAAVSGLTGFIPITPTFVAAATTAASITQDLDVMNQTNRIVGYYGKLYVEVWVKPWVPAGYLLPLIVGTALKPLAIRTRSGVWGGMVISAPFELYPLRANAIEDVFGVGVWNRTNGAALYIDSGSAGAYVVPTFSY